jgi:hypothetical protein
MLSDRVIDNLLEVSDVQDMDCCFLNEVIVTKCTGESGGPGSVNFVCDAFMNKWLEKYGYVAYSGDNSRSRINVKNWHKFMRQVDFPRFFGQQVKPRC